MSMHIQCVHFFVMYSCVSLKKPYCDDSEMIHTSPPAAPNKLPVVTLIAPQILVMDPTEIAMLSPKLVAYQQLLISMVTLLPTLAVQVLNDRSPNTCSVPELFVYSAMLPELVAVPMSNKMVMELPSIGTHFLSIHYSLSFSSLFAWFFMQNFSLCIALARIKLTQMAQSCFLCKAFIIVFHFSQLCNASTKWKSSQMCQLVSIWHRVDNIVVIYVFYYQPWNCNQ